MAHLTADDLTKLQKYVTSALDGAKAFDGYVTKAKELEEAGETLSKIQDLAKNLQFVSKLVVALQVASVAMSIIAALLPKEKTEEEKIYDSVNEVIARVKSLTQTVEVGLKSLALSQEITTEIAILLPRLAQVEAAGKIIERIAVIRKAGNDPKAEINSLLDFHASDFRSILQLIRNIVTGQSLTDSLLEQVYVHSYGDAARLAQISACLTLHADTCVMAIAAIDSERELRLAEKNSKPLHEVVTEKLESLSSEFGADLAAIRRFCGDVIDRCAGDTKMKANIERFFNDKYPAMHVTQSDYDGSGRRVVELMQSSFKFLRFSCIVYEPIDGSDHHAYASPEERRLVRLRAAGDDGTAVNLILFWFPREDTRPVAARSGAGLVPKLNYTAKPRVAAIEYYYGGAPEFVSVIDKESIQRTAAVVDFTADIARQAREEADGPPPMRWRLRDGVSNVLDPFRRKIASIGGLTDVAVWVGAVVSDNIGISSTNMACYISDERSIIYSMRDPLYSEIVAASGLGRERFNGMFGSYFHVAVFFGDRPPQAPKLIGS